jgi:hypothetical protein
MTEYAEIGGSPQALALVRTARMDKAELTLTVAARQRSLKHSISRNQTTTKADCQSDCQWAAGCHPAPQSSLAAANPRCHPEQAD